jgi:hypothetical protein
MNQDIYNRSWGEGVFTNPREEFRWSGVTKNREYPIKYMDDC